MRLELPMVVCAHSSRVIEAWLPHQELRQTGSSLAALRDDLALEVMLAFERGPVAELARYQLAPHLRLVRIDVDLRVVDRERGVKRTLAAPIGLLLEKWPADPFWLATPTRAPQLRFAVSDVAAAGPALQRRLLAWALARDVESLADLASPQREHLEVLEVDADPPTILPRTVRRAPRRRRPGAKVTTPVAPVSETPAEREERRARARLGATTLRAATRNLSHGVADDTLDRAFGRDALVDELVGALLGDGGVGLVLVGPSGVGKTAIVHEVVRRLTARNQAAGVRRDVWRIDGARFIAGQSHVGQWEARAAGLITELSATGDVLFADDLASLVYAGRTRTASTNLGQYLVPSLERGELTLLGECTDARWAQVRQEAPALAALMRVVPVPPLDRERSLPVVLGALRELESQAAGELPPRLSPQAIEVLLDRATRFRPHEALPGRAIRVLHRVLGGPGQVDDEAGARRFGPAEVWAALASETGLPDFVLGAAPPRPRADLVRELAEQVAGQPEAVEAVADAVLAMQAGLGDPDKPLCTYLLVGPTGVGKTETAKALARMLFGSADRLLRFDMSELASAHGLARLIGEPGAPDGELTAALRAQPLRVILFDEIEKAHPRVFDTLLQLLGEGRLTDAAGRTADARQAIILMTSNLGVREAAARPGFITAVDAAAAHYLAAVRAFFRPEFFGRIDRVVPFRPLDRGALRVVVEHALGRLLARRGLRQGKVMVDVEPALLELLVEQAYDPRYGARPLERLLERRLTVPLARHLVGKSGAQRALVELARRGGELALSVRLLREAAPAPTDAREVASWPHARLAEAALALRADVAALRVDPDHPLAADQAELARQLDDLDDEALEGVAWRDEVDDTMSPEERPRWKSPRAGYMGLRARPTYRQVATELGQETLVRGLRLAIGAARDGLTLLRHRLGAGPSQQGGLLLECVGPPSRAALTTVATLVPSSVLACERWDDSGGDWAAVPHFNARFRRVAFALHDPGLAVTLAPLLGGRGRGDAGGPPGRGRGPHQLPRRPHPRGGGGARRPPGGDPVGPGAGAAVAGPSAPVDRLVARQLGGPFEPLVHLGTGLPAVEHLAILAAYLRAPGGG